MNKNSPEYVGNIFISKQQSESIRLIQNFVDKNTSVKERIFFFSNEPAMYLFVNRLSPTRFDLPEVANTKEKRLEIVRALEKNKTKYIVEDTKAWSVDDINNRARLPEVVEYIQKNYSKKRLGQYIIYLRDN